VIRSFRDKDTKKLWDGQKPKRLRLQKHLMIRALDKLQYLNAAKNLADLRVPPSNHLEALKGNRKGQYSIRINDQWRICFRFEEKHAYDVEIIDYH